MSIKSRQRIGQILAHGHRIYEKNVGLMSMGREAGPARLAVLVPRRFGGAVKRNRIRRILREEARLAPNVQPLPLDLVLIWRGAIGPDAAQKAHSQAARLLQKLKT